MTSKTIKPKEVDRFSANEKAYAITELRTWFQLDSWTVRQGLLLLVGIDPYRSEDLFSTEAGFHSAPNSSWAQITARPGLSVDKVDAAGWPRITGYVLDPSQIMELSRLLNLWVSNLSHTLQDRHVPSYYLEWANGKDCNPFWQPWAIEAGLFSQQMTEPLPDDNHSTRLGDERLAWLRANGGDVMQKNKKLRFIGIKNLEKYLSAVRKVNGATSWCRRGAQSPEK